MAPSAQSNVLFVILDTVRKDHLGPYGYDRETTPALDRFASEATVFETAIAPAPWTLPVHASLFTGRYPSEHGATQERPYLEGGRTLAESVSRAGYDTACYSANAWITPYTGLTNGFDAQDSFFEVLPGDVLSGPLASAWRSINDSDPLRGIASRLVRLGAKAHARLASGERADSKTPTVIDRTTEFVESSGTGWFAFCNLLDAHLPYHPPETYRERFAPGVDPDAVCQHSKAYNSGAREIDDAEWDAIRDLYDAEIAHLDAQVGRLFDRLRETGRWDETTVIVAADHGELHGEHGLYGHEFALYEPLIDVPLLVKHPDLEAGRRDDLVELVDCYHTILDVLDVDPGEFEVGAGLTEGQTSAGEATDGADGVVALDRTRSLLADEYRDFAAVDRPDPGQRAVRGGERDHAFVEYARPIVELHHLETTAAEAGIALPDDHRAYARQRAARGADAKYIRADRIPDEGYRLDTDPDELEPVAPADDDAVAAAERALARFEDAIGDSWAATDPAEPGGDDALAEADPALRERLRELGYLE